MGFSETWTRRNASSDEMEYGYISENPCDFNDRQLATRLGLDWIKKLTVKRGDSAIHIYAGKRHWATVYPA